MPGPRITLLPLVSSDAPGPGSLFVDEAALSAGDTGAMVFGVDFCCRWWNPFMEQLTGIPARSLTGRPARVVLHPEGGVSLDTLLERAFAGEMVALPCAAVGQSGVPCQVWVAGQLLPRFGPAGDVVDVVGLVSDISALVAAGQSVLGAERRFRAVVDASHDGIAVLDAKGSISFASAALAGLLGYRDGAGPAGTHFLDAIAPAYRTVAGQHLSRVASRRGSAQFGCNLLRCDGQERSVYVRATLIADEQGEPEGIMLTVRDVSGDENLEEELRRQGACDPLTGLPNRAVLLERLKAALAAAALTRTPVALLLLDLDEFKDLNDTFGHQFGDRLLAKIGPCLESALRGTDTVARLGGDEFAIVLPDAGPARITMIAGRILMALEEAFEVEGHRVHVAASIGVSLFPEHGEDALALLRHAEIAMYQAKAAQAGCVVYTPEMNRFRPERLELIGELRHAIFNDELVVHYQPKASIKHRSVVGVEALVRWQHPGRGFIPPDQFIELAERTGLIRPLTAWVLDEAARQCAEWHREGLDVSVAVNLSQQCLHDETFVPKVRSVLERWHAEAPWITLEITESTIMANPELARRNVQELHDMGFHISIDDFGTGYSSLGQLKRLAVDEIKIDRCFVRDMRHDGDNAFIVRTVADLGHNLGLKVVAEGVEDLQTLLLLGALGLDYLQGYYLSRPLAGEDATQWLRAMCRAGGLDAVFTAAG